ncbi:PIG-L deacetylase family protein [Streptomyces scopuliridis]
MTGPGTTVLAVHAHPDDETWATGAALSTLSALGCTVHLRVASGGEASEPGQTEVAARTRRAGRLASATAALGVHHWDWLDEGRWIDTAGHPSPRSLTSTRVEDLSGTIVQHIADNNPDITLTVGADGLTGHPDHILIHQAVRHATAHPSVPVTVFGAHLLHSDIARGHGLLRAELADTTIEYTLGSGLRVSVSAMRTGPPLSGRCASASRICAPLPRGRAGRSCRIRPYGPSWRTPTESGSAWKLPAVRSSTRAASNNVRTRRFNREVQHSGPHWEATLAETRAIVGDRWPLRRIIWETLAEAPLGGTVGGETA